MFKTSVQETGKKICLVVSHLYGDEGSQYYENLVKLAKENSVKVIWAGERVGDSRGLNNAAGEKIYNLWDIYPMADFVTYPSLYEGFGNALLETFYFSNPYLLIVTQFTRMTSNLLALKL